LITILIGRQQHCPLRHWPQRVDGATIGQPMNELLEQNAIQQQRFNANMFNHSFSGTSTSGATIPIPIVPTGANSPMNNRKEYLNYNNFVLIKVIFDRLQIIHLKTMKINFLIPDHQE